MRAARERGAHVSLWEWIAFVVGAVRALWKLWRAWHPE